eukprot:CAMPEP_0170472266 /NCGR_PEP_ID=MMETSP0123-20130129/14321_1 /TAXON_ID=182087 /ORGANISM="Favella ehrenbergii, Strain Fehren 1" /LENGTH=120 /DNA_ID=CAMNT_0010740413 /DNA_START=2028 /DNA_END=2386 /DNA_ORIENTATION=-
MRQVIVSALCSNVGLGESGAKLAGGAEVGSTLGTGSCDAARLNDLHGDGAALLFLNLVFLVHAVHVDHALTHYAALGAQRRASFASGSAAAAPPGLPPVRWHHLYAAAAESAQANAAADW